MTKLYTVLLRIMPAEWISTLAGYSVPALLVLVLLILAMVGGATVRWSH